MQPRERYRSSMTGVQFPDSVGGDERAVKQEQHADEKPNRNGCAHGHLPENEVEDEEDDDDNRRPEIFVFVENDRWLFGENGGSVNEAG